MINLLDLVNKYIDDEYNEIYANAKAAQDIILRYLFKSNYKNNITLKGGVVMYNLSKNKRRVTIDIDIDLIKIFFNDDNLHKIFTSSKLNGIELNVDVNKITELKHQDYSGKYCPHRTLDMGWERFLNKIREHLEIQNKPAEEVKDNIESGSDEPVRRYVNGSTPENCYSNWQCTNKIGSLNPRESCDCFGEFKGRAMIRYKVDGKDDYKIAFCKWLGGIK